MAALRIAIRNHHANENNSIREQFRGSGISCEGPQANFWPTSQGCFCGHWAKDRRRLPHPKIRLGETEGTLWLWRHAHPPDEVDVQQSLPVSSPTWQRQVHLSRRCSDRALPIASAKKRPTRPCLRRVLTIQEALHRSQTKHGCPKPQALGWDSTIKITTLHTETSGNVLPSGLQLFEQIDCSGQPHR